MLAQGIQVARDLVKPLRLTALPYHDRLAVGHDAGHRLVVAQHLAGAAGQRHQALLLHATIGQVDDAHRFQLAIVQVDEGAIIVQRAQGCRHVLEPLLRLLPGAERTCRQQQQRDYPLHGIIP